jgi:hypothetical protein
MAELTIVSAVEDTHSTTLQRLPILTRPDKYVLKEAVRDRGLERAMDRETDLLGRKSLSGPD